MWEKQPDETHYRARGAVTKARRLKRLRHMTLVRLRHVPHKCGASKSWGAGTDVLNVPTGVLRAPCLYCSGDHLPRFFPCAAGSMQREPPSWDVESARVRIPGPWTEKRVSLNLCIAHGNGPEAQPEDLAVFFYSSLHFNYSVQLPCCHFISIVGVRRQVLSGSSTPCQQPPAPATHTPETNASGPTATFCNPPHPYRRQLLSAYSLPKQQSRGV